MKLDERDGLRRAQADSAHRTESFSRKQGLPWEKLVYMFHHDSIAASTDRCPAVSVLDWADMSCVNCNGRRVNACCRHLRQAPCTQ